MQQIVVVFTISFYDKRGDLKEDKDFNLRHKYGMRTTDNKELGEIS